MLWLLPAVHVLSSAISGYYYGRLMFVLARQQSLSEPPPAQLVFWLFNMPCLLLVTFLSGTLPISWQPQEWTRKSG